MEKNTEKTDVLRRIVSLLLILTLVTGFFVNLPLTVSAEGEGLQGGQSNIVNGSFEEPTDGRSEDLAKNTPSCYKYTSQSKVPGWNTTAVDEYIELAWMNKNVAIEKQSPHMISSVKTEIESGEGASDGWQFAETVANKVSSLFQILPVKSGEKYDWTIHHRGRSGTDTLALIITDKDNSINYGAATQDNLDCFQQIIEWMVKQGVTAPAASVMSKKYTVYTTKLSDLYSFKTVSSGSCFSYSKDKDHTEKFIIYLMSTDKSNWGTYSDSYSLDETEPDKEVLFVLTPFSTSFSSKSGGNLIDNLHFTDRRDNNLLKNPGFEDFVPTSNIGYYMANSANSSSPTSNIGWSTTDLKSQVEIGTLRYGKDSYGLDVKFNTITYNVPYIRDEDVNGDGVVDDKDGNIDELGKQFAELNASEESSLYQIVSTDPGKMYKWSLSHRGRDALDTMALIIGPAQPYAPKKKDNNKNNRDQLMQISDWLYSQTEVPLELPTDGGCSSKIKLYTPKFNSNGGWQTESSNIFSFNKDNNHTEEWSVWVIASKNDKWHDYGELDSTAKYSYECVIPAGQKNTIFGFVSHSSLKADGTKNSMSYGNLLDNIAFKEYYYAKVEVAMNKKFGTAWINPAEKDSFIFDDENNKELGWALQHSDFTVHVQTKLDRDFLGAYINGEFISKVNPGWVYNETTKEYTYIIKDVTEAIKVNIIFAAKQIYYNSRSPHPYQYDPDDSTSGPEVQMSADGLKEYISHRPSKPNEEDGWKFIGWKYINPVDNRVYMFNAVHKVKLEQNGENSPTFSIYPDKDATDPTITGIHYAEGITFLGEWKYRQRVIAQTYDDNAKVYLTSTAGGEVDVAVSYGTAETATDYELDNGEKVGKELYTLAYYLPEDTKSDENAYVTVTAEHKTGYTFSGWYDSGGKLISKNTSYTYKVPDQNTVELYARFDPAGCDLKLDCSTYSTAEEDSKKEFTIYCDFSGLRAGKLYSIVDKGINGTFQANEQGQATVILNMKNGDSAEFIFLPEGCQYTIEADPTSSAGFGVKGEVTDKLLTRPAGSQETIPVITEHIIFFKASQSALLKEGKHYVGIADGKDAITITKNSSYTLDVETRYNPSIYEGLSASLCFYDLNGDAKNFIDKTRILMIDLSDSACPNYYSYTVSSSTPKIDLEDFIMLGTADSKFELPSRSTMVTDKLVFVVDYVDTENAADSGKISLVYDNSDNELSSIINPTKKTVNIREDTTEITADVGDGKASSGGPFAIKITVNESDPAINTTYKESDFTKNSKYAVKLSLDGDKQLPDGSYAEVDGNKYFLNNGYIKIPSITARDYTVSVYTPVPVELNKGKVKFNLALSDAVSASPKVPAISEKTGTTVEFTCVEVAMDADVVDKVLNPGTVSAVEVKFKHSNLDSVGLTVYEKGSSAPITAAEVKKPTDGTLKFSFSENLPAESGKTYIFSFVGYVNGVPVLEDKCCVVGGYVVKNN